MGRCYAGGPRVVRVEGWAAQPARRWLNAAGRVANDGAENGAAVAVVTGECSWRQQITQW